jgi:hypothetical protein
MTIGTKFAIAAVLVPVVVVLVSLAIGLYISALAASFM